MNEPLEGNEYADFIRRLRRGDSLAAEELIRRYEPEIRLEVRALLRLRDPRLRRIFDSMDICQSVLASFFVQAAAGDFELDDPSQLTRLLVGMTRNRLADRVRYQQRQRRDVRRTGDFDPALHTAIRSASESPSEVISRRELTTMLRDRLSDEERSLAELRSLGLEWADVAEQLGGTPEARRKQLNRAVARVTRELGLAPVAR